MPEPDPRLDPARVDVYNEWLRQKRLELEKLNYRLAMAGADVGIPGAQKRLQEAVISAIPMAPVAPPTAPTTPALPTTTVKEILDIAFGREIKAATEATQVNTRVTKDNTDKMMLLGAAVVALRVGGAVLVATGEQALVERALVRGDLAEAARRRLAPSVAATMVGAVPGFGWVPTVERQRNVRKGLEDLARAAEVLEKTFLNFRVEVDRGMRGIVAQEIGLKYRFFPEMGAYQQQLLAIRLGPEQQIREWEETVGFYKWRVQRQETPFRGQPTWVERKLGMPWGEEREHPRLTEAREMVEWMQRPRAVEQIEMLGEQAARGRELAKEQYKISLYMGMGLAAVPSWRAVAVGAALPPEPPSEDPLVMAATLTNTLLRSIRDILSGQMPKGELSP